MRVEVEIEGLPELQKLLVRAIRKNLKCTSSILWSWSKSLLQTLMVMDIIINQNLLKFCNMLKRHITVIPGEFPGHSRLPSSPWRRDTKYMQLGDEAVPMNLR